MKTMLIKSPPSTLGLLKGLLTSLGFAAALGASSAFAADAGQVTLALGNKVFSDSQDITINSGSETIFASKFYEYEIIAKVKGEKGTFAGQFAPPNTSLAKLIEQINPGGSSFLKGIYSNTSGNRPSPVFEKTFAGVRKVKKLGKVDISITLYGQVQANGQCVMGLKNVKFKSSKGVDLGTIKFMKGSKVNFSVKPEITFDRTDKPVNEGVAGGKLVIPVWRNNNFRGAYAVSYATSPGTADSSDFVGQTGVINFADGEVKKDIEIDITNDTTDEPVESFNITLSNPTNGAYLGPIPTVRIDINDND